jgi:hypothetical protein
MLGWWNGRHIGLRRKYLRLRQLWYEREGLRNRNIMLAGCKFKELLTSKVDDNPERNS